MAEKEKLLKAENNGQTLEDDAIEFYKSIYEESAYRVDQLQEVNLENQEFYEGMDKALDSRRDDARVVRSALFVHQLTPAVDTRTGEAIARVQERERPVSLTPLNKKADAAEREQIAWCEQRLDEQLRAAGYLPSEEGASSIFEEHITAAEIYETPAAVIVGWREYPRFEPRANEPDDTSIIPTDITPTVSFSKEMVGEPYAEFIPPDEFLYEPNISLFEKDSTYVGRRQWLRKREITSLGKKYGWDRKAIRRYFENDAVEALTKTVVPDTNAEKIDADRGTPQKDSRKEGKHLLVWWWVVTYADNGTEVIRSAVVLGNKEIIYEKDDDLKAVGFPFVLMLTNRRLGSIENLSSVSKGKNMQRLYNEVFNSFIDGITYRIFPPFKKSKSNKFHETPVYGPGQIWNLDDINELMPVIENPGLMPDLPALMEAVGAKIRDLLNAQDLSQGFQSKQYEKATASKLRAMGAARRATPTHVKYGVALINVAKKFIALNQQFDEENGYRWVINVKVDVPSLTNITDPEQDKQDMLLLYSSMQQDPMFQSPAGKRKLRNAWEEVARLFRKLDAEKFFLTEQESDKDISDQVQMQQLALEKQSAQEQMALTQAQGEANAVPVQQ